MKNLGYYNGKFDEIENMSIPMGDRVCFFGDGVYDATYSRNYKIFALDEHVNRFFNSTKLLEFKLNFTKQELKELLNDLIKKMDTGDIISTKEYAINNALYEEYIDEYDESESVKYAIDVSESLKEYQNIYEPHIHTH